MNYFLYDILLTIIWELFFIMLDLDQYIGRVQDFPKKGILFYDIVPLLADADAWHVTIGRLSRAVSQMQPDLLIGIESRGFLTAAPLAAHLGLGFALVRKPGKLPGKTIGIDYKLEYGTDRLEISAGIVKPGMRVVLMDDLLATGGTLKATADLVRLVGGMVAGAACIIELESLQGRSKVDFQCFSLLQYD